MNRRAFALTALAAAPAAYLGWTFRPGAANAQDAAPAPSTTPPATPSPVAVTAEDKATWQAITERQWRERLSPEAFRVLRKHGTERPFTSPLNAEDRAGVFSCAGCDLPLFDASWKYESGTGWPSFWETYPGALGFSQDYRLWTPRLEYHCARCKGHQGHVFEDGPRPTGLRYCNNGVALSFTPASDA